MTYVCEIQNITINQSIIMQNLENQLKTLVRETYSQVAEQSLAQNADKFSGNMLAISCTSAVPAEHDFIVISKRFGQKLSGF